MKKKKIDFCSIDSQLQKRMHRKAHSSPSQYHLACAAFNKKGELLGVTTNSFRKSNIMIRKYSGYHCEMKAVHRWGMKIKSILLLRIGNGGDILPIQACPKCRKVLDKLNIKVVEIVGENE